MDEQQKIDQEEFMILCGNMPLTNLFDDHLKHISSHQEFLIEGSNILSPIQEKLMLNHIDEHNKYLQMCNQGYNSDNLFNELDSTKDFAICYHELVEYKGFTESYKYCKLCNKTEKEINGKH